MLIFEPSPLKDLAKEISKDYSQSDLIKDIFAYFSGDVEGFPITSEQAAEKHRFRKGKTSSTYVMRFLSEAATGDPNKSKELGFYPNLIQRIEANEGRPLPEEVHHKASEVLYDQKNFPKISTRERTEYEVKKLERSFYGSPEMRSYWKQLIEIVSEILGRQITLASREGLYLERAGHNSEKCNEMNGIYHLRLTDFSGQAYNQLCLAHIREATQAVWTRWEGKSFPYYISLKPEDVARTSTCPAGFHYLSFPWWPAMNNLELYAALNKSEDNLVKRMREMLFVIHIGGNVTKRDENFEIGAVHTIQSQMDLNFESWIRQNKDISSLEKVLNQTKR